MMRTLPPPHLILPLYNLFIIYKTLTHLYINSYDDLAPFLHYCIRFSRTHSCADDIPPLLHHTQGDDGVILQWIGLPLQIRLLSEVAWFDISLEVIAVIFYKNRILVFILAFLVY